jgi:hypothetical protein
MEDLSNRSYDLVLDPCSTLLAFLDDTEDPLIAEVREGRRLADSLLRQLQGCPEILPRLYCEMLGLPAGSTYGETADYLLGQIGDRNGV